MKKTRIIALLLATVMVMGSSFSVFAANGDEKEVQGTGEVQTEQVDVTYTKGASYTVTIPKTLAITDLEEDQKGAEFSVKVSGDISADYMVTVTPDKNFKMIDQGTNKKEEVEAQVFFNHNSWVVSEAEAGLVREGGVIANDLTAGTWKGNFNFTIKYEEAPV